MQTCYEKHGVLHRNINPGSLLFKAQPYGPSGKREGVLIDFDLAIDGDKHKKTATGERSNTIPFVPKDILMAWHDAQLGFNSYKRYAGMSHAFAHNLESIFYVFCWICIVIAGPNFIPRPRSDYSKFEKEDISLWFPRSSSNPSFLSSITNAYDISSS